MADTDDIFDQIMESVGDDGTFQMTFNIIFNGIFVMISTMVYNNMLISMWIPEHTCYVPGREFTNFSVEQWRDITIPNVIDTRGVKGKSSCQMYNVSFLTVGTSTELQQDFLRGNDNWNFTDHSVVDCMNGYNYDKQYFDNTAVSQENWVCNNALNRTNTYVFNRIGEVVGTFLFGQLGDTLGRRIVYYMSVFILVSGRLLALFTVSWHKVFAFACIFGSLTANSIFQSPLIIAMETSNPKRRARIAVIQNLAWSLGMCLMPILFWLLRDWITFGLITCLPTLSIIFLNYYIVESPRWLAINGRFSECSKILLKIAKINGKNATHLNEAYLQKMLPPKKQEKNYGMATFFTSFRLAKNTFLISVCWISATLGYFTMLMIVTEFPGNPFVNFLLLSLVEFPSFFAGLYLCDRIGRKLTTSVSFFITIIFCIIVSFIINDHKYHYYSIAFTILLKSFMSIAIYSCFLQSIETFPTSLRQTGISLASIVSCLFGVLGPYIVVLRKTDERYPYMVLCVIFIIGFISTIFLPETLHMKLPDSIEEAKNFGKGQKFWGIPRRPVKSEPKPKSETELLNQSQYAP